MTELNKQNTTETQEHKNEEKQEKVFNLDVEGDLKTLKEQTKSVGEFFRLDEDITYKIKLTSPLVKEVEKIFDSGPTIKYQLNITAKGSDKSEFEGSWEVGPGVLNPIMKNYSNKAIFNVSKTGKGMDTRYSVNLDF